MHTLRSLRALAHKHVYIKDTHALTYSFSAKVCSFLCAFMYNSSNGHTSGELPINFLVAFTVFCRVK